MLFIAEIGINHNGNIDIAKQLISMAKRASADVVKFQKRNPYLCVPDEQKNQIRSTPWGEMTYLDYKLKIEFEKPEYDEIDRYCKEIGIQWTASVWDLDSLNFLMQYNVPFIKIPSACITDKELLTAIAKTGKHVVMSIGMSTEDEFDEALKCLKGCNLTIMHCNSSYPSAENELDLKVVSELYETYYTGYKSVKIGYSGHEIGIMPTIIAAALGAEVIERHITLDKNMWGTDQKASLEFKELKELIDNLHKVPIWLGQSMIKCYPSEEKVKQKLRKTPSL